MEFDVRTMPQDVRRTFRLCPMSLIQHSSTLGDGTLLSASDDGTLRLWDLSKIDGDSIVVSQQETIIYTMCLTMDVRISVGIDDGSVKILQYKN